MGPRPMVMRVVVLRLGHRPERDKRITTHVGLVARAFGASEFLLSARDPSVTESLGDVVDRWGGDFVLKEDVSWKEEIRNFSRSGGKIVHLTMYGSLLSDVEMEIKKSPDIMVVVGAEKVPWELYEMADWNVAVGSQPHSEVAALAILLDRLFDGRELESDFQKKFQGRIEVVPSKRGKVVHEKRSTPVKGDDEGVS